MNTKIRLCGIKLLNLRLIFKETYHCVYCVGVYTHWLHLMLLTTWGTEKLHFINPVCGGGPQIIHFKVGRKGHDWSPGQTFWTWTLYHYQAKRKFTAQFLSFKHPDCLKILYYSIDACTLHNGFVCLQLWPWVQHVQGCTVAGWWSTAQWRENVVWVLNISCCWCAVG